MTDFKSLGLSDAVTKALSAKGYAAPTPIQARAIPAALAGRDLLGVAQTGTGKTAAFALPMVDRLAQVGGVPANKSVRALVLAPTRELAGQIAASFRAYGGFTRLSVTTVFGGAPINRQIRELAPGVDVLAATPGRLIDLLERRALTLKHVETLVLDEADQMLDLGFIHALRRILPLLPARRQTLLFSATMPKSIAALAAQYLTDPVRVEAAPQATTAERVAQEAILVAPADKPALLAQTLRDPAIDRALVFTRTKHGADKVVKKLGQAGISAAAIHGNKKQTHRERALAAFRSGACRVLVATDIAARGVDVPGVSHVVNYEVPNVPEQYVHRIGRTARAGASGLAVSFVAPDERAYMRDIEKTIRMAIPVVAPPEGFAPTEPQSAEAPRKAATPPRRRRPRRRPNGGRAVEAGGRARAGAV